MRDNDIAKAVERHVDSLLDQISLEQKTLLASGADFWSTCPNPAIGLDRIVVSDGPAGIRGTFWCDERDPSASLPSPTALAATWDESLIVRLAELLASEARRKGIHVVLGPNVNLHRSPLGGRHFECFSEDPLLTGRIAAAYVRALQSFGIGACPKHYVANDSETDRLTVDVRVDERTLREVYLAPFEDAVAAGAWLVMAAYNRVNGHTMTEHDLLRRPLKDEWGFDGVVVSDWNAIRSTTASGAADTDLAMPGPCAMWGPHLMAAVRSGQVPKEALDKKVKRILRLAARVGALTGVSQAVTASPEVTDPADLLREAAASAMVLLRNEDAVLPLDRHTLRKVALIGPNAAAPQVQGGGSVSVQPPYIVTPLEGIRAALAEDVDLMHRIGIRSEDGLPPIPISLLTNPVTGEPGLRVRFLDSDGGQVRTEDRTATRLVWLRDALKGVRTIEVHTLLKPRETGVCRLGVVGMGAYRIRVGDSVVIDEAITRDDSRTFGSAYRTSEIKLSAQEELDVVLTHHIKPGAFAAEATLGMLPPAEPSDQAIAAAVAAARESDVAIVIAGTSPHIESEGFDRSGLALPGRQDELIRAVASANPRTIVVINAGAPVELTWRDQVSAILVSWFPGQEFGRALADVLLGAREPGGRLPTTWAACENDVPVLRTQPHEGRLIYTEGLHIGYRAWARANTPPAYPFGHGLGYTTWEYRSIHVAQQIHHNQPTTVRVRIANTGERTGREVVQVYLQRPASVIERPALWLAGFTSATVAPGEEVEVEVELVPRVFQHWHPETREWETEDGTVRVLAGRSARDLRLRAELRLISND